jgi:hypothetical protein
VLSRGVCRGGDEDEGDDDKKRHKEVGCEIVLPRKKGHGHGREERHRQRREHATSHHASLESGDEQVAKKKKSCVRKVLDWL